MVFVSKSVSSKFKKVLLPGISTKDLKPLASLVTPRLLLVPMFLICNLAQISENLRGVLSSKEVQRLPSVKFYSKIISSGFSCLSISLLQSVAKTLGSEFEILSILNPYERINFLKDSYLKLLNNKTIGCSASLGYNFSDPILLSKYRNGLALQTRSIMISTAVFSFHSVVIGLSVKEITLDVIIESSRLFWSLLGLDVEEFDFLLHKEALSCSKNFNYYTGFEASLSLRNSFLILIYDEFSKFLNFAEKITFLDDQIILQGENNLTALENSIGFIERIVPNLPSEIFVSSNDLKDEILRSSFDQHRSYKLKIEGIYKMVSKTKNKVSVKKLK
uniref:putative group II intron reverse transcriptase/maturase mat5 n=1 Tax=Flexiglena variabilis TaxID=2743688 RepID=UPI0023AA39A2|nr:putative group II intron reverse transcriptase/maturase mat5 [Flexiglena variabilis]WCH63521.1 putative group II intron reverse transcriptase/maturase mat5 [Flexiglena variabilis]